MYDLHKIIVACILALSIYISFYSKIDLFTFFIVLKALHVFINILGYSTPSILVSVLYILSVSLLKFVRVVLFTIKLLICFTLILLL